MTRPSESLGGTNLISSKNSLQISVSGSTPLYNIDSATNELPLSAIDFSSNPLTPESLIMDPLDAPPLTSSSAFSPHDPRPTISPLATNERPLSCTCLATISSCDNITNHLDNENINDNCCNPPSMLRFNKSPSLKINGKLCCSSRTHNTCYSLDDINHLMFVKSSCDSLDNQYHSSCSAPVSFYCHENDNIAYCTLRKTNSGKKNSMSIYSDNNSTLNSITYKEKSISDVIINQSLKNSCNLDSHSHTVNIINSNVSNINVDLIETTSQSQFAFVDANTNASSTHNIPKINISNADASSISSSTVLTTISASSSCTETITVSNNPNTSNTNLYPITPCPQNDKLHDPDNTTSSASSSTSTSARRQRHGVAGQMSYFKMLGFGGFGKKMTTSTNSLFSTAVISGSSSAPNLRDMIPSTATPSGFGGVPPIRPLETLHNALSLKQLDQFLEKMTSAPLFKTPASSPPKYPSTPVPTPTQTTSQGSLQDRPPNFCSKLENDVVL